MYLPRKHFSPFKISKYSVNTCHAICTLTLLLHAHLDFTFHYTARLLIRFLSFKLFQKSNRE